MIINLAPNKRLLNYGIFEQLTDAVPTFLISLAMGAIIYWIQFCGFSILMILLLQMVSGFFVYIGLSRIFKEESFMYILSIIKKKSQQYIN